MWFLGISEQNWEKVEDRERILSAQDYSQSLAQDYEEVRQEWPQGHSFWVSFPPARVSYMGKCTWLSAEALGRKSSVYTIKTELPSKLLIVLLVCLKSQRECYKVL